MTVLIDTNVVMDVVFNNANLIDGSRAILDYAEQKRFIGYISASESYPIAKPGSKSPPNLVA